jgi:hypothetical protein
MNTPQSASVQPSGADAPAEADLAGIQAERGAPPNGHERIGKPRRRRIRRSIVAVLIVSLVLGFWLVGNSIYYLIT